MKLRRIFSARLILLTSLLVVGCHSPVERVMSDKGIVNGASPNYIDATKTIFPIEHYGQNVDKWIPPYTDKSRSPVMTAAAQNRYFVKLKENYFGVNEDDHSPWNHHYITSLINGPVSVKNTLDYRVKKFLSDDNISYGENFRKHTLKWKEDLRDNVAITMPDSYRNSDRAIVIRETLVRVLPSSDPAFNNPGLAGEGYPFDNFQMSSIHPGAPLYVFATSKDKSWKYIVSSSVTGWVKSDDIAAVNQQFVTSWRAAANKRLGAIIKQPVSFHDGDRFFFLARPGTILPYQLQHSDYYLVAIPVKKDDGRAQIKWVKIGNDSFTAMPWEMTPNNISYIIKSMQGRPYGWGNFNFNNDCSAEIRNLMMPFGIFLPRHSSQQILEGRVVDLSTEDASSRINYLRKHGVPFTTLIYISGHIMLYTGNTVLNGEEVPMTYQNLWGLRPKDYDSRSIIGEAVFFPILLQYPENKELHSLADKKQFKLSFLE